MKKIILIIFLKLTYNYSMNFRSIINTMKFLYSNKKRFNSSRQYNSLFLDVMKYFNDKKVINNKFCDDLSLNNIIKKRENGISDREINSNKTDLEDYSLNYINEQNKKDKKFYNDFVSNYGSKNNKYKK